MTIERRLFPARPRLNRPVSSRASVITNPNQLDWILATVIETNSVSLFAFATLDETVTNSQTLLAPLARSPSTAASPARRFRPRVLLSDVPFPADLAASPPPPSSPTL